MALSRKPVRSVHVPWFGVFLLVQGCGGSCEEGASDLASAPDLLLGVDQGAVDQRQDGQSVRIKGQVRNLSLGEYAVQPGIQVEVIGGPRTTTDQDGRFVLEGVTPGERILLTATAPALTAYSTGQLVLRGSAGETLQAYPQIMEGCTGYVDAATGGEVKLSDLCDRPAAYAALRFEPNSLVRADGTLFTGRAMVTMVPIPFPRRDAGAPDLRFFAMFPGDMTAQRKDGSQVRLESLGAAEFRVTGAGQPLQIAPGREARMQMKVYRAPAANEEFLAWSYDPARGRWIEEAGGIFKDVAGQTVFEVQVAHLSWWNVDRLTAFPACARGQLPDRSLDEIVNPTLIGETFGFVDVSRGNAFCVTGKVGEQGQMWGLAQTSNGLERLSGLVQFGRTEGTCAQPELCVDLGTLDARVEAPLCATARLIGADLKPVTQKTSLYVLSMLTVELERAGVTAKGYRGTVQPDRDGRVCLQVPSASSYVLTASGGNATIPGLAADKTGQCGVSEARCAALGDLRLSIPSLR